MMKIFSLLGFVLAAVAVDPTKTIWQTALETDSLSSLVSAFNTTQNVIDLLNSTKSTLTLFAPSNVAFAKDHPNVSTVVTYHLLNTVVTSSDLPQGLTFAKSVAGFDLKVEKQAGVEILFGISNVSKVTTADVMCAGGVVHIIDTVLDIPKKVSEVAKEAGLTMLLKALNDGNIAIDNLQNITVFAPDDTAFNTSSFDEMSEDAKKSTLRYHVVIGTFTSNTLSDGQELTSALGDKLLVKVENAEVYVGGAKVVGTDYLTSTGVVHILSSVVRVPSSPTRDIVANLALQPETTTLASVLNLPAYAAAKTKFLAVTNGTVFAPSNAAFESASLNATNVAEVTAVLDYHVVTSVAAHAKDLAAVQILPSALSNPTYVNLGGNAQVLKITKGDTVQVNGEATVTVADLDSAKDVVTHVIDTVLTIPADIVTIATAAKLTILLEQLTRTALVPSVQGASLTVLAPNNAAFDAFNGDLSTINASIVKGLLLDHVFADVSYSTILANTNNITSLGGKTYKITVADGLVTIDDAVVLAADVLTKNGVVHVIDRVLGGPAPTPTPEPNPSKGVSPGAVVGIVIGVLAGVAVVGYCCFKRNNDEDGYKPM